MGKAVPSALVSGIHQHTFLCRDERKPFSLKALMISHNFPLCWSLLAMLCVPLKRLCLSGTNYSNDSVVPCSEASAPLWQMTTIRHPAESGSARYCLVFSPQAANRRRACLIGNRAIKFRVFCPRTLGKRTIFCPRQ